MAPRQALIPVCVVEVFYTEILKLCRNGLVPYQPLLAALLRLDQTTDYAWSFEPGPTRLVAAKKLTLAMRTGLSTLRSIKTCKRRYRYYTHRLTSEYVAVIDRLLDAICVERAMATPDFCEAMQYGTMDDIGRNTNQYDKIWAGELNCPRRPDNTCPHGLGTAPQRPRCQTTMLAMSSKLATAGSSFITPNEACLLYTSDAADE